MARYIDADKLIKSLELSIQSWSGDCNSNAPTMVRVYQDVVYRVKNIPTADVVPKSEVDKLHEVIFKKEDLMQSIAKERNYYYDELQKAKQEVAREIFEEIEDVLNNIGYFDEIDFKALKKKYTKGEHDEQI